MKTTKMMAIVAVLVFGMMFALGGAAQAANIDIDDDLVPDGLGVGGSFHLAFVTSTAVSTILDDDIAFYNAFVQDAADGVYGTSVVAGRGITWYAMGSTSTVNARDNAVVSAPVYRVDGVQVATGYADIWDGSIAVPIQKTESGATSTTTFVSTGTLSNGTAQTNWWLGSVRTERLALARFPYTDGRWMYETQANYTEPMYALSEELTIVSPIPEPAGLGLIGLALLALRSRRRK